MHSQYMIRIESIFIAIADVMPIAIPGRETEHHISRINVPQRYRGQGYGSRLLRKLCDEADKEQAILTLDPLPTGGLGLEGLIAWYGRYGFEENGSRGLLGCYSLRRLPLPLQ